MNSQGLLRTFINLAKRDADAAWNWHATLTADEKEQLAKEVEILLEQTRVILDALAELGESWNQ